VTDQDTGWSQVEDLFFEALELDPAERAAFLEDRAGSDDAIAREVRDLLVAHSESGAFDRIAERWSAPFETLPPEDLAGARIGAY
jgi:hypothetical protein